MYTYEYKTVKIEGKGFINITFEIDEVLNKYGAQGWKMVSSFTQQSNGTTTIVYYTFMKENIVNA
jgi:hypothetical protein